MTTPTLRLSDLAGPDANGFSDVAVFVRADGSESEPFVVGETWPSKMVVTHFAEGESVHEPPLPVRLLGRGRLVPARIVMEGEVEAADNLIADCELYLRHEPTMMDAYGLACDRIRKLMAQLRTLAAWKAEQLAAERDRLDAERERVARELAAIANTENAQR